VIQAPREQRDSAIARRTVIAGPRFRKLAGAAAATLASLAIIPGSALGAAQAPPTAPPDEFSAADQYVESVPTSRGPNAPGVGKRPKAPLPPALSARIDREGGAVAAKLEQVATSPDLGAPPAQTASTDRKVRRARTESTPNVPSAAVGAVGEGEDGGLLRLLGAVLLITCLAVGTAGYRHRKHKNTTG
jgi:hypothetical protein